MRVAVFGATGALGQQCVSQCLDAGHKVTVLARTPSKLDPAVRDHVRVVEGDGLDASAVRETLSGNRVALFAIGVDKASPQDLCTDITAHILAAMPALGVERLVWCGGGGTDVGEDQWTIGSRFVAGFSFARAGSADAYSSVTRRISCREHSAQGRSRPNSPIVLSRTIFVTTAGSTSTNSRSATSRMWGHHYNHRVVDGGDVMNNVVKTRASGLAGSSAR